MDKIKIKMKKGAQQKVAHSALVKRSNGNYITLSKDRLLFMRNANGCS